MFNSFEKLVDDPMQWKIVPMTGIINTKFGAIRVVRVVNAEGKVLYEGVIFAEAKGAINVIVDTEDAENPRIAFVRQLRHAVIDTDYLNSIWQFGVPDIFDPEIKAHMGVDMIELPRGFTPKDVLSEAEEETQRKVIFVAEAANVNANTANTATSPLIVIAKATTLPSGRTQDPDEKIREVLWLSPEQVWDKVKLCGFTLAGLWVFLAWCRNNPDPAWKKIGRQFAIPLIEG
jgi:hypothetical protein